MFHRCIHYELQKGYYRTLFERIGNQEKKGVRTRKHATIRFIPKLDSKSNNKNNKNNIGDDGRDKNWKVKGIRPIVNMKQV